MVISAAPQACCRNRPRAASIPIQRDRGYCRKRRARTCCTLRTFGDLYEGGSDCVNATGDVYIVNQGAPEHACSFNRSQLYSDDGPPIGEVAEPWAEAAFRIRDNANLSKKAKRARCSEPVCSLRP